jgi:hypothetical protein
MQARGADHGAVRDGTASRRPIFHVLVAGAAAALIVAGLLLSRPMDAIRATSLIAGGATVLSVTARAS